MASYSSSTYKAADYNAFRPHYSSSFYKLLYKYVINEKCPKIDKTIDLGCGTGVATYPLLEISELVWGLDLSPKMINTANELLKEKCKAMGSGGGRLSKDRIKFEVGSAEEFLAAAVETSRTTTASEESSPVGTVSLITAAECIHWFRDYPRFFKQCAQLLQPNGVLAYWFYNEPVIVNYYSADCVPCSSSSSSDAAAAAAAVAADDSILKRSTEIYNKYVYDDPTLIGPYWQMPGRGILKDFCRAATESIPHGDNLYTDIKVNVFEPDQHDNNGSSDEDVLDIRKYGVTLEQYMEYIGTFSALDAYAGADVEKKDVFLELFLTELESELGWDRQVTRLDIVWSTGYTFLRRQGKEC